jgi:hypothetical protein
VCTKKIINQDKMRVYNTFTKQYEDVVPGCQADEKNISLMQPWHSLDNFSWTSLVNLVENLVSKYVATKHKTPSNYAFHRDPLYHSNA